LADVDPAQRPDGQGSQNRIAVVAVFAFQRRPVDVLPVTVLAEVIQQARLVFQRLDLLQGNDISPGLAQHVAYPVWPVRAISSVTAVDVIAGHNDPAARLFAERQCP
jgi:hypothetical protein